MDAGRIRHRFPTCPTDSLLKNAILAFFNSRAAAHVTRHFPVARPAGALGKRASNFAPGNRPRLAPKIKRLRVRFSMRRFLSFFNELLMNRRLDTVGIRRLRKKSDGGETHF